MAGAESPGVVADLGRRTEVAAKLDRLRELLEAEDLDGVLLSRQLLVSWLGAGLQSAVVRGATDGFLSVLVTRDQAIVVTQNIEGPRIAAEDPPVRLGLELVQLPWYERTVEDFVLSQVAAQRLGNDGFGPGRAVTDALLAARLALLPIEQERLRGIGHDCTVALEDTLREVQRGTSERELAAELVRRLELLRVFPSVLMVGADERRRRFRHPIVDDAVIERDVLGVFCVERDGLYVAVSRTVSVGPADPVLVERHRIACEIEAELMLATSPGTTYQEALETGVSAYERRGYPGEWTHHYQGGPIGYAPRESLVAPASTPVGAIPLAIASGQACAWNPTVQGAKSEDTFLVTDEGPDVVTESGGWPQLTCAVDGGELERPAILELG